MSFNDTIHNIIIKQKDRLKKILDNMNIITKNNIPDIKVLDKIYELDNIIENMEYKVIYIKSLISRDDNELLTYKEKQELNEEKIQKKINEIVLPYALYIRLHINNNINF